MEIFTFTETMVLCTLFFKTNFHGTLRTLFIYVYNYVCVCLNTIYTIESELYQLYL